MGNSVSLWTLSFKLLSTPNFGDHFAADDTLRKTDSIWTKMDYKICINKRGGERGETDVRRLSAG